jgi:hypothetical protein
MTALTIAARIAVLAFLVPLVAGLMARGAWRSRP